mmetsp:Transcript_1882/g.3304  ORF Transcript_1882/g.3304 Transcript_1882/m.3304 type:complete len:261 (-) Transcript_1882:463-1245(-)
MLHALHHHVVIAIVLLLGILTICIVCALRLMVMRTCRIVVLLQAFVIIHILIPFFTFVIIIGPQIRHAAAILATRSGNRIRTGRNNARIIDAGHSVHTARTFHATPIQLSLGIHQASNHPKTPRCVSAILLAAINASLQLAEPMLHFLVLAVVIQRAGHQTPFRAVLFVRVQNEQILFLSKRRGLAILSRQDVNVSTSKLRAAAVRHVVCGNLIPVLRSVHTNQLKQLLIFLLGPEILDQLALSLHVCRVGMGEHVGRWG